MTTNLSIVLKRPSKVYYEGETIAGVVVVDSSSDVRHEGLTLYMEGSVNLQLNSKNVGLFDAFTNSIKAINLVSMSVELAAAGKIPMGVTEIPFEVPLRARSPLLEAYHGVFLSVLYCLRATLRRPFLNKPLHVSCQFFVQHRPAPPLVKPARCEVSAAALRGGGPRRFHMYAELHTTVCALDKPITGKICVDECSVGIKSIELQLVRVETCAGAEGLSRDATEVQNIQVAEGDVCRGRAVPLHMVLPRLFTCPTTAAHNFKIEFELNIAVILEDDHVVTENFPILLVRCR